MPAPSQCGKGSGQHVQRAVSSFSPASPSTQLIPRRSWSFKDKQQICSEWDTALSTQQKQEVRRKWRADQIDGATIRLWKEQLNVNAASPKRVRVAKHQRKRSGAGRPAALSEEHETLIDEWVMEKRSRLLQVRVCHIQWYAREWMEETGSRGDNVTRYGNPAAAGKATYMAWIGRALRVIDQKVIEDSWRMSCAGYTRTVFHLPSKPWNLIMDFPPRKTVLATQYTAEEAAAEALLAHLQHDRKLYTARRDYAFPVKQKRKRRQPALGVATTSAPCQRRRSATVVSDVETETDDDKENEAPAGKEEAVCPTERDTRREQRYQVLMSELQEWQCESAR